CGLPVVTTNAGGIPDLVSDRISGFVVERSDHEAIAQSAIRFLENPELARTITRNALGECEKYSWTAVVQEWIDSYLELAGKNQAGQPGRLAKLRPMGSAELRARSAPALARVFSRRRWA